MTQSLLKKPLAVGAAEQKPKESQTAAPVEDAPRYTGLARYVMFALPPSRRRYADQADICPICFNPGCPWRPY